MGDFKLVSASGAEDFGGSSNILFVHGLSGDSNETWTNDSADFSFPASIKDELPEANVYSIGYDASKFYLPGSSGSGMALGDRATTLIDFLIGKGFHLKPLVFVAHSLGGIVVKQILRKCCDVTDPNMKQLSENTIGVVFLACPHDGSALSSLVERLKLPYRSQIIGALEKDGDRILELKTWYSENANENGYKTKSYFETKKTKSVLIVSESSANPSVKGSVPVPVTENHRGICKPTSKGSPVFSGTLHFIKECCEEIYTDPRITKLNEDIERYLQKVDRETLEEKLSAAGRGHEINRALTMKESFDKELRKNSLQESAKTKYRNALNDVESRFQRHVHSLIVEKASNPDVNKSLQEHVIDPVVKKHETTDGFHAGKVDEMIYFLTGQCYIRWNHE